MTAPRALKFRTIPCICLWHLAATAFASTTNCKQEESVLFSCSSGARVISYCAAPASGREHYLEYRYSSKGTPGLVYRVGETTNDRKFKRASVRGASASATALWFRNAGYTYILNDPVKGVPYLEVLQSGSRVSLIQCTDHIEGDSEKPNKLIEESTSEEYFNLLRAR